MPADSDPAGLPAVSIDRTGAAVARRPVRAAAIVAFAAILVLAPVYGQAASLAAIHLYQRTIAPLAGAIGIRCRFTPTCSRYAEIVIARDGLVVGGWQALGRIGRCGPWTRRGTVDPP